MALNDLYDIDHDSVHQQYRPIPSGQITFVRARAVTFGLFVFAFFCLSIAPYRIGLVAGVALLTVIWLYNRFHKRHSVAVLAMAGARLFIYIVTALAISGQVSKTIWLAGGLQAAYILTITIVARRKSHAIGQRRDVWPSIPWMLAAIPICDGLVLAMLIDPAWLAVGIGGTILTRMAQRYIRGD
ncbi:hypothetical protein AQ611_22775 [Burkholderia singularis]|nr:hypothetical protein AQ611_22775 [Burkholderia sp. Bp7605]